MEGTARIEGLEAAMKAMGAAFPKNPEQQRRILNQSISFAARKSIIPRAKQLALKGDGSGALSESIAPRAVSRARALRRGKTASVQVTPVRGNRKAIAMYIAHYRRNSAAQVVSGIRHGHLVEFGHRTRSGGFVSAKPFLWPAAVAGMSGYRKNFAASIKRKTELAVRRARRKAK